MRAPARAPRRQRRRSASTTLSSTVRPSNSDGTWVLMPTPSRAMAKRSRPVTSRPRQRMRPAVGLSWPVRHLKKVLLPAPLGPIRQRSSPSATAKSPRRPRRRRRSAWSGPWSASSALTQATRRRSRGSSRLRGRQQSQAATTRTATHEQHAPAAGWGRGRAACRPRWSASAPGCSRSPARQACRGRRRSPR